MVKKKATADSPTNVTPIDAAKHTRGKRSGLGYDPKTGREVRSATYVDDEYDAFTLDDPHGYQANRFYTKSRNAHDHRERMQVSVPQGIDSQILAAVAAIPQYRSPQDFWRDAAIHRLEWLQHHYQMDDDMRRFVELERMDADTDRAVDEVRTMTASVAALNAALAEHYEAQDWQMLADEITRAGGRVEWLREPYKTEALRVLKDWKGRAAEGLAKRQADRERDDR